MRQTFEKLKLAPLQRPSPAQLCGNADKPVRPVPNVRRRRRVPKPLHSVGKAGPLLPQPYQRRARLYHVGAFPPMKPLRTRHQQRRRHQLYGLVKPPRHQNYNVGNPLSVTQLDGGKKQNAPLQIALPLLKRGQRWHPPKVCRTLPLLCKRQP